MAVHPALDREGEDGQQLFFGVRVSPPRQADETDADRVPQLHILFAGHGQEYVAFRGILKNRGHFLRITAGRSPALPAFPPTLVLPLQLTDDHVAVDLPERGTDMRAEEAVH